PARRGARNPLRESTAPASCFTLERVDELAVAAYDVGYCLFAGDSVGPPGDERIPETGPADCKADEPGNFGRRRKPFLHFAVVCSAPEDDASKVVASVSPRGGDDVRTVLGSLESFDLPDVGFDARVLQLLDGFRHEPWPKFEVVCLLISIDLVQLGFGRGDD